MRFYNFFLKLEICAQRNYRLKLTIYSVKHFLIHRETYLLSSSGELKSYGNLYTILMRGKFESKVFFEVGAQLFFESYNLTIWNSESYNLSYSLFVSLFGKPIHYSITWLAIWSSYSCFKTWGFATNPLPLIASLFHYWYQQLVKKQ